MLCMIVIEGIGKNVNVLGMCVGGKIGIVDKVVEGGYNCFMMVLIFVCVFLMDVLCYVVIVMFDSLKGLVLFFG